ncbi:MAG: DUF2917 domain-containing protein [Chthoniobacteraceae bacterium]
MNTKPLQTSPHLWEFSQGIKRPAQVAARHVGLKPDEMLCLEKSSGVNRLEVRQGVVWVTETPATRDVLLQAGDRFEFSGRWPVVVQALEEAQAVLLG